MKLLSIIKYIFIFLLTILISINLVLFIESKYSKEKIPNIFNYGILTVKSNSMAPTFNINDIILVKKDNKFTKNDILVYIDEDENLVSHRLIEKKNNKYIMQGDANNTIESIKKDQAIARVVWYGKSSTELLTIISNRAVMILLLVIIFLIPNKRGQKNEKEIKTKAFN